MLIHELTIAWTTIGAYQESRLCGSTCIISGLVKKEMLLIQFSYLHLVRIKLDRQRYDYHIQIWFWYIFPYDL